MKFYTHLDMEPLRSTAFGAIGAAYTAIGIPNTHPIRKLILQNFTDALLLFSIDGDTDHAILPAGGQAIFDFDEVSFGVGKSVYVKQSGVPTAGSVYVSAVHGYTPYNR